MTYEEWCKTIEDDVEAIDFCYHGQVWDLLQKAFEAGEDRSNNYWNP
jgi:hypothetical protein